MSKRHALTKKEIKLFRTLVHKHFAQEGRDLPWRKTTDPYKILVSEVMLQQTQVERVLPKYKEFLQRFPTVRKLAGSTLGDVLRVWSGLGYNRRAKMLWECAREVVEVRKGKFPTTYDELNQLRGIGPYTAGAVAAFAYNQPVVMIETNIRSVYLHHFFKDREGVHDKDLLPLIEATLDRENPRLWYNMLMDYGSHLKAVHGNPSRKSKHHTKQKPFKGSDRELRGAILRALRQDAQTLSAILLSVQQDRARILMQLNKLAAEGLVEKVGRKWQLP